MKQYDPEQLYCAVAITFLIAFFGACQLMQSYQVDPLKKTAIQKGYATYTIPNTNEPTLSVFTWK
jgi:hypothetical protein